MHTTRNQVVRLLQGEASPFQPTHPVPDAPREPALQGYYFLLQTKPGKPRRKNQQVNTVCAFGPYGSACEASFIRTSARALGLLEAETSA